MYHAVLLRVHRWITLIFSVPLLVLVLTGLVLSFEPVAQTTAAKPGILNTSALKDILDRHDPASKARGLSFRPYDDVLALSGVGEDGIDVDVSSGQEVEDDAFSWAEIFGTARRLHEHLVFDLGWLVTASTVAMLALVMLGVLMGWPRLRMSVSGWHKGIAWFTLPLVILSPLTGLALAYGITLSSGFGPERSAPLPLRQAIEVVARSHDLSNLIWLRVRGGRQLARINESGEYRLYMVKADGLTPVARNWPRLIHEGNWAGIWSALVNIVTSFSILGLLGTGLYLWASRKLRRRKPRHRAIEPASPVITS
ncbi:MAG: PepSY domain-containing protein [Xanthobacteraceae bacterium]|nr:MAG: PepSY domain-containing protein [Xanthobacteraceae bacterium]